MSQVNTAALEVSADQETFHDCASSPASPQPQQIPPVNGASDRPETIGKENILIDGNKKKTTEKEIAISKRNKKKEEKSMDHVLRALSSLSTPEEKLVALCKQYSDLIEENKQQTSAANAATKKVTQVSRERDALQAENGRLILAKDRLESLSRELQRQNKLVKEDSLQRQKDEEERRKEVTSRFQTTITDIQGQMSSHSERNDKLQTDNKELTGKLTTLLEQYEKREESVKQLLHHKEMETKLFETKLEQTMAMFKAEEQKHIQEKQALLEQLISTNTAMKAMQISEAGLQQQVAFYTEKYSEFESTLSKSNEVFATYKKESEKMSKIIRKLEKDNKSYKQNVEGSNKVLMEMIQIKQKHEQIIQTLQAKNERLEKLCRALQARSGKSENPDSNPVEQKQESGDGKPESSSTVGIEPSPAESESPSELSSAASSTENTESETHSTGENPTEVLNSEATDTSPAVEESETGSSSSKDGGETDPENMPSSDEGIVPTSQDDTQSDLKPSE